MPPVDRNNPKRAASSDSKWSLMEFQRTFPDDATCLDWLWRTRYSEDGTHAECPKCEQVRSFKKYEIKNRGTSWTCTGCGQLALQLLGGNPATSACHQVHRVEPQVQRRGRLVKDR